MYAGGVWTPDNDRIDAQVVKLLGNRWRRACTDSAPGVIRHHPNTRAITNEPQSRWINTVVCDGVKGLTEAINTVWSQAVIQTYVIHLLRNTFRYESRKYWDQIAKDIRPVYTAPSEDAAKERFVEFAAKWGQQYPPVIRLWENA